MHSAFALELSDIDLWNTDLLDKHLDLLSPDKNTDIHSKYFVCLHKIFKTSSRHVFKTFSRHAFMSSRRFQDMSSRRLQPNNFSSSKTSWRRLGRRKNVTLKTCWRRVQEVSWRRLKYVFKTKKCFLGTCQIKMKVVKSNKTDYQP